MPTDLTLAQTDTATLRKVFGQAVLQTAKGLRTHAQLRPQLAQLPERTLLQRLTEPSVAVLGRTLLLQPFPLHADDRARVALELVSRLSNQAEPDASTRVPIDAAFPALVLALRDNNPLPIFAEHPERHGNVVGLGDHELGEWMAMLRQCLAVIAQHMPLLADEMRLLLRHIVPAGYDAEKHQSASYLHHLGVIYLTLHPSVMTMTEALIHEFQHNKLHALLQLDPVLANGTLPQFASPVRPDLRPLRGILLAVHAFLPVAALYRRMLAAGDPLAKSHYFAVRMAQIDAINHQGCETLRHHGQWTPVGRRLWPQIDQLDRNFAPKADLA